MCDGLVVCCNLNENEYMQIRCPDCLQAIQINGNVALTAIRCDNCEAEIQLVDADEVAAEIRSV